MVLAPLEGLRVVEFGQYIAVPAAAQILADQGATVIKVEPPSGEAARNVGGTDGFGSGMFRAYNRSKQMVSLDLKSEAGRGSARSLALDADVVLSNLRPGVMDDFGLSPDILRQERPELVCLTLSGFGDEANKRKRPGLDIAAQAESGIMWVTGAAGGEPQRVGFPVVDAAAAYVAAQAVTAALFARFRFGHGADIRLSLWDVAIHIQGSNWVSYSLDGRAPVRRGGGQARVAPAAEVLAVSDGYIVLSAYIDAHWTRLCTVLDLSDALADPRFSSAESRSEHRSELLALLSRSLCSLTRSTALSLLHSAGIVAGAVKEYPEVIDARGVGADSPFIERSDSDRIPGSASWTLGAPCRWAGVEAEGLAPRRIGQDNGIWVGEPRSGERLG